MILSSFIGREKHIFDDPEKKRFVSFALARKLHNKYIEEWGVVNCHGVQLKILGRPYYLWDSEEMKKFDEAGGHTDKCPHVVGATARWVIEILAEEKLI